MSATLRVLPGDDVFSGVGAVGLPVGDPASFFRSPPEPTTIAG
jgi:hypothetical protein